MTDASEREEDTMDEQIQQQPETASIAGQAGDDHTRVAGDMGMTPMPHPSEDHNSSGITMIGPPDDAPSHSSAYFNGSESTDS